MRKILFRGKTKKGVWIYGVPTYDLKYIFNDEQLDSVDRYEVIPETVGQFTGLTDKNGKEIYEFDIIKTETGKLMEVKWLDRRACFYLQRDGWAFVYYFGEAVEPNYCEIIGNIHENPELIKKDRMKL